MMNIKNTQLLTQIDWDNEIANEPILSDDEQGERLMDATMVWVIAEQTFSERNTMSEDYEKANVLRALQYFYGKFIYHHARYYDRDADVKQSLKDTIKLKGFFATMMKGKLPKSNMTFDTLKELEQIFIDIEQKRRTEEKKKDGGYPEAAEYFTEFGLELISNDCVSNHGDRDSVCFMYDDVRYMEYL